MSSESVWRNKSDEDVLAAVEKLDEYTPEGQRVILAEAERRRSPEYLGSLAAADKKRQDIHEAIQKGLCPSCGKTNITRHTRWLTVGLLLVGLIVTQSFGQEMASGLFPSGTGSAMYATIFATTLTVFLFAGAILGGISAAAGNDKCKDCGHKWR